MNCTHWTLNAEQKSCFSCIKYFVFAPSPLPPPHPRLCILSPLPNMLSSSAANCYGCSEAGSVTIEGPLRRKTLLKEGRKPRVRWSLISLWFKFLSVVLKCGLLCQQMNSLMTVSEMFSAYPFICCVAVVVMDQILDHSVWINTDILWGKSTEGLWEEACKFELLRLFHCLNLQFLWQVF